MVGKGGNSLNTFPLGNLSSLRQWNIIFSVLPDANVRVMLRTGILPFSLVPMTNRFQLEKHHTVALVPKSQNENSLAISLCIITSIYNLLLH